MSDSPITRTTARSALETARDVLAALPPDPGIDAARKHVDDALNALADASGTEQQDGVFVPVHPHLVPAEPSDS